MENTNANAVVLNGTQNQRRHQIRQDEWQKFRDEKSEEYKRILNKNPILGFLPDPNIINYADTPAGNEKIFLSLKELLIGNCAILGSQNAVPSISIGTALDECREYTANYTWQSFNQFYPQATKVSGRKSEGRLFVLDWEKRFASKTPADRLAVISLNPMAVKVRQETHPKDRALVEELKKENDREETKAMVLELSAYVAIGVACIFAIKKLQKVPLVGQAFQWIGSKLGPKAARLAEPFLCTFGPGLPINFYFWFSDRAKYNEAFAEVFSTPPGQEIYQELKKLDGAKLGETLSTLFLFIGSGIPELTRALRPMMGSNLLNALEMAVPK